MDFAFNMKTETIFLLKRDEASMLINSDSLEFYLDL